MEKILRASEIHSAAPKSCLQAPEQGWRDVVSSALGSQSVWSKKMQVREPGAKSLRSAWAQSVRAQVREWQGVSN